MSGGDSCCYLEKEHRAAGGARMLFSMAGPGRPHCLTQSQSLPGLSSVAHGFGNITPLLNRTCGPALDSIVDTFGLAS